MIKLLPSIIFAFLTSDAVKNLVVDLLAAYAERSDNKVDDYTVDLIDGSYWMKKKATEK